MNLEKFKIDKHRTLNLHPLSSKNPLDISLSTFGFPMELKNLKESSVLYSQYNPKDDDIWIFIDLESEERAGYANSYGKNSVLIKKISMNQMGPFSSRLLRLASQYPVQFKIAGIKLLWILSENNRFLIEIQVDNESLLNSFEDEKIIELSQYIVGRIINSFFNSLRLWNSSSLEFWPNNPIYNSKEGSDFFAFFNSLEKTTEDWQPEAGNEYQVRDDLLNSQLMDYQKTTVKWMISREIDGKNADFCGLFQSLPIQSIFYYPALGVFSRKPDLSIESIPNGGILADEMGLGKTVEMLALIVSNRKEVKGNIKRNDDKKEEQLDWKQYKQQKSKKIDIFPVVYTAERNPTNAQKLDILRKCSKCQENCVLKKCGWKEDFDAEKIAFLCPQCMAKEDPLEVGTTLIIMPETLSMQWYKEIVKHCNENLKVMFYFGMSNTGYLNPHNIAKYDLIFVTYQTLVGELVFTNFKNKDKFGTRKYSPSSLNHVKWWRLITDESQLVELGVSKPAQMCQIIKAKYRWAMSGTPLLKNIGTLGGLFEYVDFWPLSNEHFWNNFVIPDFIDKARKNQADQSWLIKLGSQVMRRNSKSMVEAQIKLPELVEIDKIVKFSTIEERQYKNDRDELKSSIENVVNTMGNEILVRNMIGRERILQALIVLKETLISCGEHLQEPHKRKNNEIVISEPINILFRMICKKKREIHEILRLIVKCSNIDSDVYWLENNFDGVARGYEEVLRMIETIQDLNTNIGRLVKIENVKKEEEIEENDETPAKRRKLDPKDEFDEDDEDFNEENLVEDGAEEENGNDEKSIAKLRQKTLETVKIETTSMIHTMVNLKQLAEFFPKASKIIENFGGISRIQEELDSSILSYVKEDLTRFEKMRSNVNRSYEKEQKICENMFGSLARFYENQEIGDDFFVKSLDLEKVEELSENLAFWPIFQDSKKHLTDGAVKLDEPIRKEKTNNYHNEKECMGICNNLSFSELYPNYKLATNSEVYKNLSIYLITIVDMSQELKEDFGLLIDYLKDLSNYEKINNALLAMSHCQHPILNKINIDENERKMEKDKLKCKICRVYHSLIHFRYLIGLGSFHGIPKNENARKKLEITKLVEMILEKEPRRKFVKLDEFGSFHKYIIGLHKMTKFIQIYCTKLAAYEKKLRMLKIAKYRRSMNTMRRNYDSMKKKDETDEEFDRKILEISHNRNIRTVQTHVPVMKQKCIEFRYLVTLCEELNGENDKDSNCCPVCWQDFEILAILPCAHRICEDCYFQFKDRSPFSITCVTCRRTFQHIEILMACQPKNHENNVISGVILAVKLEETIKLIRQILRENEENKIVLFTNFDINRPIWKFLTSVLHRAKVPFIEVNTVNYGKNMSEFENSKNCRVLLCSLSRCANGLNLTHANHIIFLDPTHLSSVIQQAIGRIARIGQKNTMKVYHMIVETSIDEEIRKIARTGMNVNGQAIEKTDLTVGQLRQIFGIPQI